MKNRKKFDVRIERILFDDNGHITAVDLHDEDLGEAIFCEATDRHYHGKFGKKEIKNEKGEGDERI